MFDVDMIENKTGEMKINDYEYDVVSELWM
jgi:hypothetical protein